MIITVTQEDIDHGKRGSPTNCPVGHALHRKYRRSYANIYRITVFDRIDREHRFRCSKELTKVMEEFDDGEGMEPFSFDLNWRVRVATKK